MKVGYYPGCSLEGSASDYALSVAKMAELLGIELVEIEDWSCCGASAAHSLDHLLSVALPARNLALARSQGLDQVFAPCAACSNRLISASVEVRENREVRSKVEDVIGMPLGDEVRVFNMLDFIQSYGLDALKSRVTRPLAGLRGACYYGCLLVRPPKVVQFDDAENPQSMEKILAALGGTPVEWHFKVECCGAGLTMAQTRVVTRLVREILKNAEANGAEAIVVACPLCHQNLDMRQAGVNAEYREKHRLPIYYISELIALALGASPKEVGLDRHFVEARERIASLGASGKG
jgi:heterodisulfide reductase subunit B